MITVSLLPGPLLPEGVDTPVRLCLTNTGPITCLNIEAEFETPSGLLLVQGDRLIERGRLGPQEQHEHPVRLRPTRRLTGVITLPSLSYGDVDGDSHDASGATVAFVVGPAPATPPSPPPRQVTRAAPLGPIFISHRSTDSPWALRLLVTDLRRGLRPRRVYADFDGLEIAHNWRARLRSELECCSMLIALIGPTWSSGSEVLRWEIEVALERGIPLLPVLVDGAHMPRAKDLPHAIRALADQKAARIDERNYRHDLMEIELCIRRALAGGSHGGSGRRS